MVAEDDVEMAHVLRFLFEREGYDVVVVEDGRQALARVRGDDPLDLIVLDEMMPFVNGLQVVRELRERSGWADVPVLMVSGKSGEDDIVVAFDAGVNDYVTKPFRPQELAARVRGLLERHGAVRVA